MQCLKHFLLYNGKSFPSETLSAPYVFDLQCIKYRKYGVPVLFNQSFDIGYAKIEIAPLNQRDEIGVALYADIQVNLDKLPEKYTVGLDIHIDERHYIRPGVELAINKDKWITTSPGSWLVTDATINAIIITEGETMTWLIDGCKSTTTQTQQMGETKEMEHTHTQTENYDLSQPICENPQLALEALKQIIQANKDGNNETAIFMTVKRCQTCGAWPTCRLDSDGQHVTIAIECSQNTDHQRIIGLWHETVKDIIRTWNHMNSNPFMDPAPSCEQKNDDATTNERIKNYDWDAPITDPWLAEDVFNDCIRKQLEPEKAKMKIARCARCGEYPVADVAVDTFILGCPKCKRIFWARKCDSLTAIVANWNSEQEIIETNKESLINTKQRENEMATTGEMIEKYDWNEPIANNRVLAADALEACIERNFPNQSQFDGAYMYGIPAKMEILRHRNSGEIPKVIKAEDGSNIGIGVDGFCYVWANPSDTLTTLVNKWNKLQGKDEKHDSDGKASVISPNDTNITIFIYKHGDTIEYYDKKYVIDTEHVKLDNVVFAKNPRVFSQPERVPITPYIKEGDIRVDIPAKTLNELDISNIHFSGVILKEHICEDKHIIDEFALLEVYYGAQSNYLFDRHEESAKETSLDVMGRNALTLPQQTKTIEELEAEADRGLSKPEDVQKLKDANVLTDAQKAIAEVCDEIKELLLEKNRKYGNSALNPCRIFARSDRLEQIRVRIDDKLNRIKNEQWNEDEDVVKDLIGYLVLYTVAQLHDFNN